MWVRAAALFSPRPGSTEPRREAVWVIVRVIVTAIACNRMRMAASEAMRMRIERDETVRMLHIRTCLLGSGDRSRFQASKQASPYV